MGKPSVHPPQGCGCLPWTLYQEYRQAAGHTSRLCEPGPGLGHAQGLLWGAAPQDGWQAEQRDGPTPSLTAPSLQSASAAPKFHSSSWEPQFVNSPLPHFLLLSLPLPPATWRGGRVGVGERSSNTLVPVAGALELDTPTSRILERWCVGGSWKDHWIQVTGKPRQTGWSLLQGNYLESSWVYLQV